MLYRIEVTLVELEEDDALPPRPIHQPLTISMPGCHTKEEAESNFVQFCYKLGWWTAPKTTVAGSEAF
jgi:hypothetical protein